VRTSLGVRKTTGIKASPTWALATSHPGGSLAEESAEKSAPRRFSWSLGNIRMSAPVGGIQHGQPNRPAASPLPMQAKLEVGAVDDPLEREADRVAEQVMRMPDAAAFTNSTTPFSSPALQVGSPTTSDATVQRKCSCGGSCETCKGQQSDDKHGQVQRKPAAPQISAVGPSVLARGSAPPIVHEVLHSTGQPLDAATRGFFEPRFGQNLNHVRVHADTRAADSATTMGAMAYTVGSNVVFGRDRFSPHSTTGRNLLAHELAHVIQQASGSPGTLRRTPCLHGSDCKFIPGDPGRFGEGVDTPPKKGEFSLEIGHAEISDPSAPKDAPRPSRQGQLAPILKKLVEDSGFKIAAEASGPFIDEGLTAEVEAQAVPCAKFPGGLPKGAPKDGCCIQIYPEMENRAKRLLESKSPRTHAQDEDALDLIGTVLHEAEHCHFDASPETAKKIPAESDCNLNTVVFHGPRTKFDFTVKFYLSELSAIIAELRLYFQNFEASATKQNHDLLHEQEIWKALNKDESVRGIIHGLKCACSCESVDHLIENAVRNALNSWPEGQARKFLEVMARILPSWWPKGFRDL
jgi:hypothetical protein